MPDPVVSPAETLRRARVTIISGLNWYAGKGKACATNATAALEWLDALLAVGERDKAEIEAGQLSADVVADVHGLRDRLADWVIGDGTMISLRDVLDELCRILDPTVPPAGERDRQQIARLTEALKQIAVEIRPGTLAASLSADQHVAALWEVVRHYSATARAVLADEEDADNG